MMSLFVLFEGPDPETATPFTNGNNQTPKSTERRQSRHTISLPYRGEVRVGIGLLLLISGRRSESQKTMYLTTVVFQVTMRLSSIDHSILKETLLNVYNYGLPQLAAAFLLDTPWPSCMLSLVPSLGKQNPLTSKTKANL